MSRYGTIHKTRFKELGFTMIEAGCWQCVDLTGERPAQVGAQYPTKEQLLINLEAYAAEYGCDGASKPNRPARVRVTVTVKGGIAEVTKQEGDVEVTIIDLDVR